MERRNAGNPAAGLAGGPRGNRGPGGGRRQENHNVPAGRGASRPGGGHHHGPDGPLSARIPGQPGGGRARGSGHAGPGDGPQQPTRSLRRQRGWAGTPGRRPIGLGGPAAPAGRLRRHTGQGRRSPHALAQVSPPRGALAAGGSEHGDTAGLGPGCRSAPGRAGGSPAGVLRSSPGPGGGADPRRRTLGHTAGPAGRPQPGE